MTAVANLDRIAWIDTARGFGIILVVYAHAIRGVFPSPGGMPTIWKGQDTIIYAFHMALFFILAGLFLWVSLEKGRNPYLTDKVTMVVYPYLLWSLVMGGIEMLFAPYVNSPVTINDLISIPIRPIEQFWFLYSLFVCQIFVLLCYPRKWLLYALAPVGFAIHFFASDGGMITQSLFWLPFVVLGVAAAPVLCALANASLNTRLVTTMAAWGLFALLMTLAPDDGSLNVVTRLATGVTGGVGVIGAAMLVPAGPVTQWISKLGVASLAIYVMHTIFSAGARVVLGWAIPGMDPAAGIVIATIIGIAAPFAIFLVADHFGYGRILGIGGGRLRTVGRRHSFKTVTSE